MGPGSQIWTGFADPDSCIATYSIALGRVNSFTEGVWKYTADDPTAKTNITFGGANDANYTGKSNLAISGNSDYEYELSSFGFGEVYQTDGQDSSAYFYQLNSSYPALFSTNFRGLGLPADVYVQFVTLLEYITQDNVTCSNTLDGICQLPGPCANWTAFTDFSFQVNFTSGEDAMYMRVPLATFAHEVKYSGGNAQCNINVVYLNSLNTQSQQIIFGGMFFQEFFGVFMNNYTDPYKPSQMAKLYVGQNSLYASYIGNEVLPEGTNPFVPQPVPPAPTPESGGVSTTWIVILSVVCALLIGFLGYAIYRWKVGTIQNNYRQPQVNSSEQQPLNATGNTSG